MKSWMVRFVSQFVKQFYSEAANIPPQVLLPNEVEEGQYYQAVAAHQNATARKLNCWSPGAVKKRDLVNLASENAVETLRSLRARWEGRY